MEKSFLESPLFLSFSQIPDPRVRKRCKYTLIEVIVISICGVMCGCEGWVEIEEIEEFANERVDFFKRFFSLNGGIPSHDTFARCFSLLDPTLFESAFMHWICSVKGVGEKAISIDGKAISGTHRGFNSGTYPLYLVNVLCQESGLTLSQMRAEGPGHGEIFAAEECLEKLMLEGTLVTMDAGIGVKRISDKIRERNGDYLLPLKKNQKYSLKVVKELFEEKKRKSEDAESSEKGRGREEKRSVRVLKVTTKDHAYLENWKDLKTAIEIKRERKVLKTEEKTQQTFYYISSRKLSAFEALKAIRNHWLIENKLHWGLDVSFLEDSWKVRERIAAENLSLVRKICFNFLQKTPGKQSKRIKMKKASWNLNYLETVLFETKF